ncbi:hypothetical protein XI09_08930 [Bradyrhizobium sp. CCBAU 11386]|uniref:hypothetical protein n=1 Tax=unclassified Bradyrhizobium TaxID=2631580 RepID=UPI0023038BD7|nr:MULTISPECIES: hypothetical protein [unclassified Bradyrhizobium]MDA9489515.1 hypothetical protein [Bradyrhizobium sp. CCBAU 11361]MDA9504841.1 hypothetical protein [Bradyrhizobium sp. CCBAU 11386]MDA9535321.1 hypothetical protein [Bradyrhizobium sp. CCBAU 21362]
MSDRIQSASASHAEFMRAANDELAKFERSEREFRKKDRDERAKRLQLPVETYDAEDWRIRKLSSSLHRT